MWDVLNLAVDVATQVVRGRYSWLVLLFAAGVIGMCVVMAN